jgi:hypothetical protein
MKDLAAMLALSALLLTGGVVNRASCAEPKVDQASKPDGVPLKGLLLECHPGKHRFEASEPVVIHCVLTNTTDTTIPWRDRHFYLFEGETNWIFVELTLPSFSSSQPLSDPLPPHGSVHFLLLTATTIKHFSGRIIYDRLDVKPRLAIRASEEIAKHSDHWVRSNPFEYERAVRE